MSRDRGFKIKYQVIDCDGCGASRFRGIACPDCGRRHADWEIDQELQHRRRELAAAREDLAALDTAGQPDPLIDETVFDEILDLVPRLVPALQQAAEPRGDAMNLRRLIQDLVAIRHRLARAKERRPYIGVIRAATTVVRELEQAVVGYLDALTAAVPLQAQTHADRAQQHLDRSVDALNDVQDQLEAAAPSTSAAFPPCSRRCWRCSCSRAGQMRWGWSPPPMPGSSSS